MADASDSAPACKRSGQVHIGSDKFFLRYLAHTHTYTHYRYEYHKYTQNTLLGWPTPMAQNATADPTAAAAVAVSSVPMSGTMTCTMTIGGFFGQSTNSVPDRRAHAHTVASLVAAPAVEANESVGRRTRIVTPSH